MLTPYVNRDSATARLRKMGVPKEKYSLFIHSIAGSKSVEVDLDAVMESLRVKTVEQITEDFKPSSKREKSKKVTVSSRIKELVNQGLTNPQIWDIVKPEFGLGPHQKHYPAWYRSAQKRERVAARVKEM